MRDFNHSVNVLVKAYLSGTLEHADSCGCAAGNLIAEACGIVIEKHGKFMSWKNNLAHWFTTVMLVESYTLGYEQIKKSGYTIEEIRDIEQAFERTWKINQFGKFKGIKSTQHDADGFKGLMCVVDVLAEIHGIDLTQKEEAKLLFVKQ